MAYLTQSDRDKISEAVREAEKYTTGEIVPMIVSQSDDYPGARWRLAVVISLFLGFVAYFFLGNFDPIWILWVQIPGLYIGHGLGAFGVLLKPFLVNSKMDEELHQRALQAFLAHDLQATKERTGILIMASLLERRVEIVADAGIHAKVSEDTWHGIVHNMIARTKSANLTEGFCLAIRECGKVLAKDFPKTPDNPNEISNKVIEEE